MHWRDIIRRPIVTENVLQVVELMNSVSWRMDDQWTFGVSLPNGQSAQVDVLVVERCKYTTTVVLTQKGLASWLDAHQMSVRIYLDAQVAEVIACQRGRHFQSIYEYPNKKMYQQDEKVQLNRFLGEWLSHCLNFGHSLQDFVLA